MFSKRSTAVLLLLIAASIVLFQSLGSLRKQNMQTQVVTIFFPGQPYSTDPQDYDAFVHHVLLRPIFSSIVSQYKAGEFVGSLAKEWQSSNNFQTWTFVIRNDVFFSNGDPVSAENIKASWTRTAYLMKNHSSRAGFFEYVVGFERLENASSEFPGIEVNGNKITVHLTEPKPKFLETVSFGLYGVAHPRDYDRHTGSWLGGKQPISSGPYVVEGWNDSYVSLKLRDSFPPDLRHSSGVSNFHFVWKEEFRSSADIVVTEDIDPSLPKDFRFVGPNKSGIRYLRIIPWKSKNHPLAQKETRQQLRTHFYQQLETMGFQPVRSFFPTTMQHISELKDPRAQSFPTSFTLRYAARPVKVPMYLSLPAALKAAFHPGAFSNATISMPLSELRKISDEATENGPFDMVLLGTGVLVEDPEEDIRFMVESKEGIRLPDPTGNLHKIVSQKGFNPQDVNAQLWEDAIIWPINHFSLGLWYNPEQLDLSLLNHSLPPTDLAWIGFK